MAKPLDPLYGAPGCGQPGWTARTRTPAQHCDRRRVRTLSASACQSPADVGHCASKGGWRRGERAHHHRCLLADSQKGQGQLRGCSDRPQKPQRQGLPEVNVYGGWGRCLRGITCPQVCRICPHPDKAKKTLPASAVGGRSREHSPADFRARPSSADCGVGIDFRGAQTSLEFTTPVISRLLEGTPMSRSSSSASAPSAAGRAHAPLTQAPAPHAPAPL